MKKMTLFTISFLMLASVCFAENINSDIKSEIKQQSSKIGKDFSKNIEKIMQEQGKTPDELIKQLYPMFIKTEAESYIKSQLAKDPNWRIKDIRFVEMREERLGGSMDMYTENYYIFKITSTSGEKEIRARNSWGGLLSAISSWEKGDTRVSEALNKLMKKLYPEFIGTVAEQPIKSKFATDPNWRIEKSGPSLKDSIKYLGTRQGEIITAPSEGINREVFYVFDFNGVRVETKYQYKRDELIPAIYKWMLKHNVR